MTDTTLENVTENPAPAAADPASDTKPVAPPSPTGEVKETAPTEGVPAQAPEGDKLADWIEAAARGDEKRAERLKRFTDPGAIYDALEQTQKTLHESGRVKIPGEKATPEELAAWNKQMGVPEKPEDYKIKPNLPEGFKFSELDQGIVERITKELHSRGGILAHPQVITAMQEVYAKSNEEAQSQLVARATEIHQETQALLDKEYGADKARNLAFGKGFVERFADPNDPDEVKDLFQLPLMNGAKLGDYLPFVRMMARAGREFGDDPLFAEIGANGSDNISTLQEQKAAIIKLRADGKFREFDAAKPQLDQIDDALRRAARKA